MISGLALLAQLALQAPAQVRIDSFRWSGELRAGATVEATNPYGNLLARLAADGRFELSAMIQGFTSGEKDFELHIEPGEALLRIQVLKRSGSRAVFVRDAAGRFEGRVDVTLMVPPGVALVARTTEGDVQVRGLQSDVRAETTEGDIEVRAEGSVEASTAGGNIVAALHGRSWPRPASLRSGSGAIWIELPQRCSLRLAAAAAGGITVDLPDLFERLGGPVQHLFLVLYGGANALSAESRSGPIHLTAQAAP
jgi:hypothetical protein